MIVSACALVCAAGCNDTAVVLRVRSNQIIDGLCIGLDAAATHRFGRRYSLAMQPLPQTLSVLAGGAHDFTAQVTGFRRGVPQAQVRRAMSFRDSQVDRVDVSLDTCAPQPATNAQFHVLAHADGAFDHAMPVSGPGTPQLLATGPGQT